MDSAQAPLMADNRRGDDLDNDGAEDIRPHRSNKTDNANPGIFVVILTIAAGISGLLFGCKLRAGI
jgi:SP family myo-inositol transporter-like MFS transporter 13